MPDFSASESFLTRTPKQVNRQLPSGTKGSNRQCVATLVWSPDAALGDADGAARHPYQKQGTSPVAKAPSVYRFLPIFTATGTFCHESGFPLVFEEDPLRSGNVAGGFGELDGAVAIALDLGPQPGGEAEQLGDGHSLQVAFFNFVLEAFQVGGEFPPAVGARAEDGFDEVLGLGGAEVLDFVLILSAPFDERGLGDVQLNGDAVEAPALRAQEDKAFDGFLIVHNLVDGGGGNRAAPAGQRTETRGAVGEVIAQVF